ncbi:MAG: hypothetical protein QOI01_4562 [Mycobacterium sp.]|jgi:hypothetical protein|nr:hypothetical protein [Mycobacterium sp.]
MGVTSHGGCGTINLDLLTTFTQESMGHPTVPFQDFREFLDALRSHGELIDVDRPVALELEVAKAMRKSASVSGPAIVFKNNGTDFPLVGGLYNSRCTTRGRRR